MLYLLWSREHQAYWKANHHGYVTSAAEAALFTLEEAVEQCRQANLFLDTKPPQDLIVPVTDESVLNSTTN